MPQALGDLLDAEYGDAQGRQFDGQRQPVEELADLRHRLAHAGRLQVKAAGALRARRANSATAPSIASPGTRHTCSPPMPSG